MLKDQERERGPDRSAPALVRSLAAVPRRYPIGWASAWTVLLLCLVLAPARLLPSERTLSLADYIPHLDLVVHFALFAGFALGWLRVSGSRFQWWAVGAAGLFLAAGTEYAQGLPFIHRDANLLDGLADSAGVAAVLVVSAVGLRERGGVGREP
jgi:hypothetical protein